MNTDPSEAEAERTTAGRARSPGGRWLEVMAIVGLVLVWPVGVVLLLLSHVWTTKDKLIGMLVLPDGWIVPATWAWWVASGATFGTCTMTCERPTRYFDVELPGLLSKRTGGGPCRDSQEHRDQLRSRSLPSSANRRCRLLGQEGIALRPRKAIELNSNGRRSRALEAVLPPRLRKRRLRNRVNVHVNAMG